MQDERKRVWIDRFQTRLFLRMGGYWLIYQVTLANLVFVWRLLHEGAGNLAEQYGRFCLDYAPVLVGCLVLLPVLAWDAVKFAHRVSGPLYNLRKAMRSVAAGEPVRPIRLRQEDFLTEVRDDFNAMLDSLQQRGVHVLKPADPAASAKDHQPA